MSTEESVDHQLLEQTKQQIRTLISEIARLAKSDISALEFYTEFLNRVVQALAAVGGAVWTPGEAGGLELQYQINLRETQLANNEADQVRHGRLLHQVMRGGEGMLVAPNSGAGDDEQAGNPTNLLLVLGPLKGDQEVAGVVEVFQRPGTRPNTQRGYLRFLLQMCELASEFLKTRQLRHFTDRQALWVQMDHFARAVHMSLDPRETAYTLANEGRRLIECDRVSVAIRKGRKSFIQAISGQDLFDKRSNTVALLNRLATAVVRTGDAVWYTGDTTDMAPQVEEAVQAYVDDSHSKTVAILPLKRPADAEDETAPRETLGALIVEQIEESRPRAGMEQRVDLVCEHSASALTNSLDHHNLFLMPLWRAIGKSRWLIQARTLPKTIAVAVAVLAVILALIVIPMDFELEGNGTLEPVTRSDIWAPQPGIVQDLFVDHGDPVQAGQPLLVIHSPDLEIEMEGLVGRLESTIERLAGIEGALVEKNLSEQERISAQGDLADLVEQRESLQAQIELVKEKQTQLTVTSDIDGEVLSWNLEYQLKGRSVEPGQRLLTVADPTREWELELDMPEDRMGHVTRQKQRQKGEPLKVLFRLATDPDTELTGTVSDIHYSAEAGEEGNTVLIRVNIDKTKLPSEPRRGAEVTARVYCGRVSLGYWLFHDLIGWVQREILFRL